ncbi:hypothetical protein F4778DRAFT_575819 [Xylariomycetidae sp. FL2044]|nr:hypothetical protein F4778DRAFT_575819 [Xylariomycetidae sp. FL2044]
MSAEPTPRPRILYPDSGPEPPFPLRMEGTVISGFGRGSKELGIPTANLPVDATATPWIEDAESGVYFGWASLALPPPTTTQAHVDHPQNSNSNSTSTTKPTTTTTTTTTTTDTSTSSPSSSSPSPYLIYPMVMSIGYNPFYRNTVRSAEVHVLHRFAADFYGARMRLLILGFVRPERDYAGLDALVRDINIDCDVARQSLDRPAWTPAQGAIVVVDEQAGGAQEEEKEEEEKQKGSRTSRTSRTRTRTKSGTLDGTWLVS